uniref:Uncharacterized protein n=1 Tax=Cacopsylla melanoneura TaxID=428564 RepID=A0A8D8R0J5_9HEMI
MFKKELFFPLQNNYASVKQTTLVGVEVPISSQDELPWKRGHHIFTWLILLYLIPTSFTPINDQLQAPRLGTGCIHKVLVMTGLMNGIVLISKGLIFQFVCLFTFYLLSTLMFQITHFCGDK